MKNAMNAACKHTFAICAYKKSPYLTDCLDSITKQSGECSDIFIASSTPSAWLEDIASSYGVNLYINEGEAGIGQDWNFAYLHAKTPYVTIAHQDDVYCSQYAQTAVDALESFPSSLIFFSDYGELRNGERVTDNRLLNIKRRLLAPLKNRKKAASTGRKRAALRFGSAICCPSVTFNAANCPNPPFVVGMKSNLDWATWEKLSRLEGEFLYEPSVCMYHRIHEESTTTKLIASQERGKEDLQMLCQFWPAPVAWAIDKVYAKGMSSNEL